MITTWKKHNDVNYELTGLLIPDKNQGPNGAWADPAEKADSIMLSKTSIDMWKGSSTSLAAVVQPWTALNQGVTWTSSDESIATVDAAGNVTAVSAGTCLITATSNKNPDVSASCRLSQPCAGHPHGCDAGCCGQSHALLLGFGACRNLDAGPSSGH